MISLPMVSRMSRGGMQVIIESLRKSGVPMAWFPAGRRAVDDHAALLERLHEFSRQALPTSTVRSGRRPHMPRISESTGTFSEVAGSSGRMTELSHRPTITRQRIPVVQELTIFAATVFLRPPSASGAGYLDNNYKLQLRWRERHGLDPVVASPSDLPMSQLYHLLFNCNMKLHRHLSKTNKSKLFKCTKC